MTTEKWGTVLACMLLIMTVGASAEASMIGVNFVGAGASLAATDSSGYVPQTNWNNATGVSGTGLALNDESGTATGATVTYNSYGGFGLQSFPWWEGAASVPADQQMMNGVIMAFYLEGNGSATTMASATVSDIPYDLYDAYVYIGSDRNAHTTMITIGAANYYSIYNQYSQTEFAFVEITSIDPNNPTQYGNYIHLSGLTSDTFSVTEQTLPGWFAPSTPGIYGIQIVAVPEPGTMMLLGLGGLGAVIRRRKN